MAKTAAERAKEYRERKRDAKCDATVTITKADRHVDVTDISTIKALHKAMAGRTKLPTVPVNFKCRGMVLTGGGELTPFEREHYKPASELGPGEHNPVSKPGDADYDGCMVKTEHGWCVVSRLDGADYPRGVNRP